jgi:hypothetical protein
MPYDHTSPQVTETRPNFGTRQVPQDQDLGVLGVIGPGEQGEPAEHVEHRQVGESW